MPGKHTNLVKSVFSYLGSNFTGRPYAWGMPPFVSIELTNCCNLSCPECPSGSGMLSRNKGYMSTGLFSRITGEMKEYLFGINMYFQGEPMLHPDLFTLIEMAGDIRSVLSTNGHFLSVENAQRLAASRLGRLVVSLDGTSAETYSLYRRGGDIRKVMDGIENVSAAREKNHSKMQLEIQFLVNRFNEHQITGIKNFARKVDASVRLKSMQVINEENAGWWMPSIPRFTRYIKSKGTWVRKGSMADRCARLWFNPVITWDGKVVPCCFDKDATYIMGDLQVSSFSEVWHGRNYKIFREDVLSGRSKIGICRNCTSGLRGVSY